MATPAAVTTGMSRNAYYLLIEQGGYDNDNGTVYHYYMPYYFIPFALLGELEELLSRTKHFKLVGKGYFPAQVNELRKASPTANPRVFVLDGEFVKSKDVRKFVNIFTQCQDISTIEPAWYMGNINFNSPRYGCGTCEACNPQIVCNHACSVCCKK